MRYKRGRQNRTEHIDQRQSEANLLAFSG